MKKDAKDNLGEDYSGPLGPAVDLIHDPWVAHFVSQSLALGNKNMLAWFLYTLGYSFLLSKRGDLTLQVLKVLENLDENLTELLFFRMKQTPAMIGLDFAW